MQNIHNGSIWVHKRLIMPQAIEKCAILIGVDYYASDFFKLVKFWGRDLIRGFYEWNSKKFNDAEILEGNINSGFFKFDKSWGWYNRVD